MAALAREPISYEATKVNRATCKFLASLLTVVWISNFSNSFGQTSIQDQDLKLGFTQGIFVDVNFSDAKAAAKVWSQGLMHKRGMRGVADAIIYEEIASMMLAVERREVDMVTMLAKEYLELEGKMQIEPRFLTTRRGRITESSLLLAHRLSGIRAIEDLRGKSVILAGDARASIARIWLTNLVMDEGFSSLNDFFGKTSEATKYSHTVLPVFFRQADACLVPKAGFETMSELNPQLGKDLQIIKESPAFLSSVLCFRRDYSSRQVLMDALRDLHAEPAGQQLLTMFRVDKLVSYDDSYLNSARETLNHRAAKGSRGLQSAAR